MNKTCLCCGKPIAKRVCDYCGFVDVEVIAADADGFLNAEIAAYRAEAAARITDIRIVSYRYKWNESKSRLELEKKEALKLADGSDCYPTIHWCDRPFGQMAAGKNITVDICYQCNGIKKQLSCTVCAVQCDDFWKVGLMIDQSLRLKVFLGTEKTYAESAALDLQLQ